MNNNGHVTLDWLTLHKAAIVGVTRQVRAIRDNLPDKHGCNPIDGWRIHIEGACAEAAVALYVGLPWQPDINAFHAIPDLANMEIRSNSRHSWDLVVRKDDNPNQIYVHVTGRAPHYWIRGWIRGTDAQRAEWWSNPHNREYVWYVPNSELNPMSELLERIDR